MQCNVVHPVYNFHIAEKCPEPCPSIRKGLETFYQLKWSMHFQNLWKKLNRRKYTFFTTQSVWIVTKSHFMQGITNFSIMHLQITSLKNDEFVWIVMLDISKAYNCISIDYKILLKKILNAGRRGNMFKCSLNHILSDREQKVALNDSETLYLGLVQGSCLNCLFFIIFVKNFFQSMSF